MKKFLILFAAVLIFSGCETLYEALKGDVGTDFDQYVRVNGAPTSQYKTKSGDIVYSFIKPCNNTQGSQEKTVVVDTNNIIQEITIVRSCPTVSQNK